MATPYAERWGRSIPRPQHVIVLGPMYHVNGFSGLFNLLAGDLLVVMEKFDAALVVDVIERYRVTTFSCTPTMLKRIADLPGHRRARPLEHRVDQPGGGADAARTSSAAGPS